MKTKIFNLIILDESGSMDCMRQQTINGCNETIDTIIDAQKHYVETQEHVVSIYAFHSSFSLPSHYLVEGVPASELKHITSADYEPSGCTPLYDAIGKTLSALQQEMEKEESAIGSVTIITDGEENDSTDYNGKQIANLILALKEKGWNFNFIGANIDVKQVADRLNIDNYLAFKQTKQDVDRMFRTERHSRMSYFARVSASCSDDILDDEERNARFCEASRNYFQEPDEDDSSMDESDKDQ